MQSGNITCNKYDGYDDGNTPEDDVVDLPLDTSTVKLSGSFDAKEIGGRAWNENSSYLYGDVVSYGCNLYAALTANIFCQPDITIEKWQLVEFPGDKGEQGKQGIQGDSGVQGGVGVQGAVGPAGSIGPRGIPVPVGPNGGLQEELKVAAMSGDIEIDAIIKVAAEVKVQADLVASLVENALAEMNQFDIDLQRKINKATSEALKMIAQASDIEITKINNLP